MTQSTFVPASAPAKTPRHRIDPQVAASIAASKAITGNDPVVAQPADDTKVKVNVPHSYNLTTDDHQVHEYREGPQLMPRTHAFHAYSIANGVTEIKS